MKFLFFCFFMSASMHAQKPSVMQVVGDCGINHQQIGEIFNNCVALAPIYRSGGLPFWYAYFGCGGAVTGFVFQVMICVADNINFFGVDSAAARPSVSMTPQELLAVIKMALSQNETRSELIQILQNYSHCR